MAILTVTALKSMAQGSFTSRNMRFQSYFCIDALKMNENAVVCDMMILMIRISIAKQRLSHRKKTGVWYHYPISTAAQGTGNQRNSWQTPLGKHRIYQKIGANMPKFTAFRGRKARGIYQQGVDNTKKDWILSRILWLDGVQTGINRRGGVDTRSRYIYIHGTHDEEHIGTPHSHGCIRMKNEDVMVLFDKVDVGESVIIST